MKAAATPPPSTLGLRKTFEDVELTIQPVLTPDAGQHATMYVDTVLQLLKSAEKSIYVQTQYVHPSAASADAGFMLLIVVLSDAYANGLDVRIICSQYENTAQWLEKLKPYNLDTILRIQERVHNKGIVVDSSVVLVSSQNWSADGVLRNRDAGLILHNADIAQYFEAIFLDDWTKRADQKLVSTESRESTSNLHAPTIEEHALMIITHRIFALTVGIAIAGCSGAPSSQTAFAPSSDVRSASGTPAQLAARNLTGIPLPAAASASRLKSWMSPDAKKQAQLLYVADQSSNAVDVLSYPQGKPEGTLSGFNEPAGVCSDTAGNVYILNGGGTSIDVYAHGAKSPTRSIDLPGFPQLNCVVDPKSGSLALGVITNGGNEFAVFAKAKGTPAVYSPSGQNGFPGCAYDAKSNLFCDAYSSSGAFALYELPSKSTNVSAVSVSGATGLVAGPMQWDGKHLTFGSGARGTIYQIDSGKSGDSIGDSIVLNGTGSVWQYWIAANRIIAPTEGGSLGAQVAIYKYPNAAAVLKSITGPADPDGAAISTLKK